MVTNYALDMRFCLIGCSEVNDSYYLLLYQPISTRKKHHSSVWYILILDNSLP